MPKSPTKTISGFNNQKEKTKLLQKKGALRERIFCSWERWGNTSGAKLPYRSLGAPKKTRERFV